MNILRHIAVVLLLAVGAVAPATAKGPTILSVQGLDGTVAEFDLAQLEALEPLTIVTHTKWTNGPQTFVGVRVSTLMEAAGVAPGNSVHAVALNDYHVELPSADFSEYPVIVAYRHNGEYMPVRDKGPLWIVYPQDDFRTLRTFATEAKMIWQLRQLKVVE